MATTSELGANSYAGPTETTLTPAAFLLRSYAISEALMKSSSGLVPLRAVVKAARSPAVAVEARGAAIMEQWKRARKAKHLAAAVEVPGVALANYTPKKHLQH
ncbi:uncharacterized protein LOC142803957 [Rhipicephalus microplus]|uniref:uncharacterized protein LOC142803957 n=1 Tax=Rhipicephalus microplus TaxID=6941 RepID=UPI003F6B194A